MLDDGLFRIGGEEYAGEDGGYGLVTLEKRHVRMDKGRILFHYSGKAGKDQVIALADPDLATAMERLRRRRSGSDRLLAYKESRRWKDLTSAEVNDFLKDLLGPDASAKDFRTWHATVLAAVTLARHRPTSKRARKRAVAQAMSEVADYLGNTAAVARSSYVDPRVIDLFEDGRTVDSAVARVDPTRRSARAAAERSVLDLLLS
jgi:DNA topoisomerase-1